MKHKTNGEVNKTFDKSESFMMRVAGIDDEVLVCKIMRDLLVRIKEVFCVTPVSREIYNILESATECTEMAFEGHECGDLFDIYYKLGVVLIELGYEDLGVTCQYLHHTYRNRSYPSWPPARAWQNERGEELLVLVPVFNVPFDAFEADTENDIKRIPA